MPTTGLLRLKGILTGLPGRTILVILTVMFTAVGLMLVFLLDPFTSSIFLTAIVQAGLGISSGLVARLLLGGQARMLQLSVAMVAMIMGQGIFGIISQGVLGLQLSQFQAGYSLERMLQIMWCVAVTFLVTFAWNRRTVMQSPQNRSVSKKKKKGQIIPKKKRDEIQPANKKIKTTSDRSKNNIPTTAMVNRVKRNGAEVARPTKKMSQPGSMNPLKGWKEKLRLQHNKLGQNKFLQINLPKVTLPRSTKWITPKKLKVKVVRQVARTGDWISSSLRFNRKVKSNNGRVILRPEKLEKKFSKRISGRRRTDKVKLVGEEEHICPYCLEKITRNDPRGLKKCSICKTWHHADCWAEAGNCQVPHFHK